MINKNLHAYYYNIMISAIQNGYSWKDLPSYYSLDKCIFNKRKKHYYILFKIYKSLEVDFNVMNNNTSIVSLTVF